MKILHEKRYIHGLKLAGIERQTFSEALLHFSSATSIGLPEGHEIA
ncbi:MAG: hypothetical protein L6Q71_01150 [Planctomycetes bacterium]|nr:hypothetical protein [Planctomycetota bacterium]